MFDKNNGTANDYNIRNNRHKPAVPKPITKSHRLAGRLNALGADVFYKTGMGDQFFLSEAIRKMESTLVVLSIFDFETA